MSSAEMSVSRGLGAMACLQGNVLSLSWENWSLIVDYLYNQVNKVISF